ncbi:glycosyltransferase [Nitrococcus mobilis]|uniref:Glycosyl transferase, family 2 n=1 Tax=Nitrococcus mobilis Nb-231 TaxID=314278 RepID=A4BNF2_9GAMM|nr:glycosyltransferase [Nitrococcus mobilis]EAR22751.1 Glycosyl transferase, family 2 [Nitrococcus mobilis Nb-231]
MQVAAAAATNEYQSEKIAPRIVISVVSHGQGDLIRGLLTDIHKHWNSEGLHLVLTQNLREDTPLEMERLAFPTRVIRNTHPNSFSANHNAAFEVFDSDVFCVVNPDIRCPEDPLPALLGALAQPDIGVAAPLVKTPQSVVEGSARRRITPWRLALRISGLARRLEYKIERDPIYPDWVAGMFMALHSGDFRRLGGFDERYRLYCEDADLCMRLWAAGRRVMLVPKALVVHDAQRDSHRKLRYLSWHVASLLRFFVCHPFYRRIRAAPTERMEVPCRHL